MSFQKLVEAFNHRTDLPIELPEIRAAIVAMGVQDEILFIPEPMDPGQLKGFYYQYRASNGVYAESSAVSLVVYTNQLPIQQQRLIAAKEVIHVLDNAVEKVRSEDECEQLLTKLLGPLNTETWDIADFRAWKDKVAAYQAMMVLFPDAAREEGRKARAENRLTVAQIAEIASLPEDMVAFVLHDDWAMIKKDLLDC